jgi:hypothetical protein
MTLNPMTFNSKSLVRFFLYFIFLTTISIWDLLFQYVVFICVTIVFIFMVFSKGTFPKFNFVDIFALIPLLTWFYGLSVGIINSNSVVGIVRNFAGLLFYITYFIMVFSGISRRTLITVLINASIIYLVMALYFAFNSIMTREFLVFNEANGTSSVRFYFSVGLYIFIPTLFIYLSLSNPMLRSCCKKLSWVKKNNFIVVGLLISIFLSGSKGAYLSVIILISILWFISLLYTMEKIAMRFYSLLVLVLFFSVITYFQSEIIKILGTIFMGEFNSDHPRVVQAKALIGDFTFFGKGLGAVVPGYARDVLGYGFELSFHNIIHKFGIFSIFMFSSFLAPIFYSIYQIIYKTSNVYSYLPLIFMLYLIPAWGNPTIFATVSVLLHCIALYFIRRSVTANVKTTHLQRLKMDLLEENGHSTIQRSGEIINSKKSVETSVNI